METAYEWGQRHGSCPEALEMRRAYASQADWWRACPRGETVEVSNAPQVDSVYTRPDGARIRVDHVANGWVYYVAWRPGREIGNPLRMPIADWRFLMGMEGMNAPKAK